MKIVSIELLLPLTKTLLMLALGKSIKQIENKKMDLLKINHEEILAGINLVDLDGFG